MQFKQINQYKKIFIIILYNIQSLILTFTTYNPLLFYILNNTKKFNIKQRISIYFSKQNTLKIDLYRLFLYNILSLTVLKVKMPLKPSVLLAFRAFLFRFET